MFRSRLYPIIDVDVAAHRGWTASDLARAVLMGGADLLQIRAKQLSGRDMLTLCDDVVRDAQAHAARVVINDRADIAVAARADGVHVGQDDLDPTAVRGIVARGPYRWVRHPLYTGEFVLMAACVLAAPDGLRLAALAGAAALLVVRIRAEEEVLMASTPYRDYARGVAWRLVPGLW